MRDLYHIVKYAQSFSPAAQAATVTGTGVDLSEFESANATIAMGALTDGTHTPKLQESSDNATFTDVAATNLLGSFAALVAATPQSVGYIGGLRYIRLFVTVSGATTGAVYGGIVTEGHPRHLPTTITQAP